MAVFGEVERNQKLKSKKQKAEDGNQGTGDRGGISNIEHPMSNYEVRRKKAEGGQTRSVWRVVEQVTVEQEKAGLPHSTTLRAGFAQDRQRLCNPRNNPRLRCSRASLRGGFNLPFTIDD